MKIRNGYPTRPMDADRPKNLGGRVIAHAVGREKMRIIIE
jgi:hypothetical protein